MQQRPRERGLAKRELALVARSDFNLVSVLTASIQSLAVQLKKMNQAISGVYFLQDGEFVKVGYANDVYRRINTLQIGNLRH